jgi:hypothetical protein
MAVATSKIWEVGKEGLSRKGNWLWWWWIFYFDEPAPHPRQLMVLWSTKNEKKINCNGLDIELRDDFVRREGKSLNVDGAVAAWYYDGKKMRENYLLDQTPVIIDGKSIRTRKPDTEFKELKSGFKVSLRKNDFRIGPIQKKGFYAPEFHESAFPLGYSYDILKITRAPFKSNIGNGTAYFQRVRVNAPAPPWYWGVYHFESGACVHYYEPHLGKTVFSNRAEKAWRFPVKKHFQFFDGKKTFDNRNVKVKRIDEAENPAFEITTDGADGKGRMLVESYASAAWKFRKSKWNRLDYNEYPALATEFSFKNNSGEWTLDDLGAGRGNSEHATGLLW